MTQSTKSGSFLWSIMNYCAALKNVGIKGALILSRHIGPRCPIMKQQSRFGMKQFVWCSSATTLIMNRIKFDGQKFSKCPNMIRQSGGHARGAMAPLGLDQS